MAGSEVVAWYKESEGFGWQAVIRTQASASNPIPQADCYLSPPFSSCKLCLLSEGERERGGAVGVCGFFSAGCVCACVCICEYKPASACMCVCIS